MMVFISTANSAKSMCDGFYQNVMVLLEPPSAMFSLEECFYFIEGERDLPWPPRQSGLKSVCDADGVDDDDDDDGDDDDADDDDDDDPDNDIEY